MPVRWRFRGSFIYASDVLQWHRFASPFLRHLPTLLAAVYLSAIFGNFHDIRKTQKKYFSAVIDGPVPAQTMTAPAPRRKSKQRIRRNMPIYSKLSGKLWQCHSLMLGPIFAEGHCSPIPIRCYDNQPPAPAADNFLLTSDPSRPCWTIIPQ